jgi:hypothetical protein
MNKNIVIGVLALIVLAAGAYTFASHTRLLGAGNPTGPAHEQMETFKQGLLIGQNGTGFSLYASGTCVLKGDFSITASTTRNVSCTGITLRDGRTYTGASTDIVDVQLAASTTMASQYWVKSAQASTSANGSVELQLVNFTGTNATPAATSGFGSSTQYQIFR